MDAWPGHQIKLVKGSTRYQGRKVGCISVEAPPVGDDIDQTMRPLKAEVF